MNENKVRYISLIAMALETLFAYFIYGGMLFGWRLSALGVQGSRLPFDMIIFLLVFFGIGSFIVLSSFFKLPFYIFSFIQIAAALFIIVSAGFHLMMIFLCLVVLSPQIFYYIARNVKSSKA